jgi:hypothetical protein
LAFIGWGAINARVGALLRERKTPAEIVGIATIDTPEARAGLPSGVPFLGSPAELAGLKPDLVIEAAGRVAISQWAPAALTTAPAMIIASTSAFCDDDLLAWLIELAERNGGQMSIGVQIFGRRSPGLGGQYCRPNDSSEASFRSTATPDSNDSVSAARYSWRRVEPIPDGSSMRRGRLSHGLSHDLPVSGLIVPPAREGHRRRFSEAK